MTTHAADALPTPIDIEGAERKSFFDQRREYAANTKRDNAMTLRAADGSRMLPLEHANELSLAEEGVVGACGKFQHHLADPNTTYCAVYTRSDLQEHAKKTAGGAAAAISAPPTAAFDRSVADYATAPTMSGGNARPVVFDFGDALPIKRVDEQSTGYTVDPRVPISLLLAERNGGAAPSARAKVEKEETKKSKTKARKTKKNAPPTNATVFDL